MPESNASPGRHNIMMGHSTAVSAWPDTTRDIKLSAKHLAPNAKHVSKTMLLMGQIRVLGGG